MKYATPTDQGYSICSGRHNELTFLATGYFEKVYRSLQVRVPHNILKKLPQKRSQQSICISIEFTKTVSSVYLHIYRIHKKKIILCFNSISNINVCIYILKFFRIIFKSSILNVHNDPCFEESSSLTLRYSPVNFSENSCI